MSREPNAGRCCPVPQGLIRRINRFNAAHPWSHNDFYRPWVLRQLPNGMSRTIDLGCGAGNLVRAISARAFAAEGIDADADIIAVAQRGAGARLRSRSWSATS